MTWKVKWQTDVKQGAGKWRLGRTGSEPEAGEAKSGKVHWWDPAGDLT